VYNVKEVFSQKVIFLFPQIVKFQHKEQQMQQLQHPRRSHHWRRRCSPKLWHLWPEVCLFLILLVNKWKALLFEKPQIKKIFQPRVNQSGWQLQTGLHHKHLLKNFVTTALTGFMPRFNQSGWPLQTGLHHENLVKFLLRQLLLDPC
jgi:hypothetical protein